MKMGTAIKLRQSDKVTMWDYSHSHPYPHPMSNIYHDHNYKL